MKKDLNENFVIAAIHEWNAKKAIELQKKYGEQITFIDSQDELNISYLREINPRYIFFPHWSWIVPNEILNEFECVCFHMTDVPFGRGGSPLQNLISRGIRSTKLTALQMEGELDAGPVYYKRDLSLEGRAEEIYERASIISFELIEKMILEKPLPQPQAGTPTLFKRRKPAESEITSNLCSIEKLYDHIRMLDAPGYPKAFFEAGSFVFTFKKCSLENNKIVGEFEVSLKEG